MGFWVVAGERPEILDRAAEDASRLPHRRGNAGRPGRGARSRGDDEGPGQDRSRADREAGARPAFLVTAGTRPPCASRSTTRSFTASRERPACKDGDIVGLDLGCVVDGFYGDAARSVGVGGSAPRRTGCSRSPRSALHAGIARVQAGEPHRRHRRMRPEHAEGHGYSVVREFVGHGIGTSLHEEPQVPNYGPPGRRERLVAGMCLAIEPMLNVGRPEVARPRRRLDGRDGRRQPIGPLRAFGGGDAPGPLGPVRALPVRAATREPCLRERSWVNARVIAGLPNALYRVELEDGSRLQVTAHATAELLRILPGDGVVVELHVAGHDPGAYRGEEGLTGL